MKGIFLLPALLVGLRWMDKLFDDKQWISPSIFLPSPSLKRPPASALVLMVSKKKYNFIAVHKPAQFSLKSELLLDSWHNDEEEVWRQKSLWKMLRDFPMMMPNTSDSGKHADERRKDEKLSRNNKKKTTSASPHFNFVVHGMFLSCLKCSLLVRLLSPP